MQRKITNTPERIRGRIERVYYAGPKFSAGRLLTATGEEIQFAGNLFAQECQPVVLLGSWTTHPKYGRQFKVDGMEYDLELDPEGLIHYLANHPEITGIGPVKARIIVEKFGDAFEKTLIDEPESIAKAARLSIEVANRLRNEWLKNRSVNSVLAWLSAFGLTHHQVTTLVEKLGGNCLNILKHDPYILIREIRGFGFKKVDRIARKLGTPKDYKPRIRAGLQYCVREALDNGHCWIEYEHLVDQANLLLVMDTLDSRVCIEKVLDELVEEKTLACESHAGRFVVALPEIIRMESELSALFGQAQDSNPHFRSTASFDALIERCSVTPNDKQFEAIRSALSHCLSLISGGAGSGKSFTVAAINAICEDCDLTVVLAAPTGKAAKRLEEVSGRSGTTIHRLLGYNGKSFARNKEDPIDADVLIVDEFSMVDVPLAWHLFDAVDLSHTAVVLVGDHNQLPPVGPGNILRDLIQTRAIPTVVLDKVVRQAGVLKENCTAILKGEVRKTSETSVSGCRDWYLVDQFTDPVAARGFLLELFEKRLEALGFDIVKDVQVLTPTHKGPLGTKELNQALQRLIQKKLWNVQVPPVPAGRRPQLFKHDKVIQTRNNYDIDVMNGSLGHVVEVLSDGTIVIDFEGTIVDLEKGSPNLQDVQLAFALSVHKAQGSEFPCAVVVVHKSHSFMHHRNLLYTGVTRARRTAIVLGDHWGINNCAKRCLVDDRRTFLALFLDNAPGAKTAGAGVA
jgi:exodeoxyribonuclease V alpha subunit